jgi:hypothetical protein
VRGSVALVLADRPVTPSGPPATSPAASARWARSGGCAFDTLLVSASRRGLEIELAPYDLVALTGGALAPLASA